MEQLQNGAMVDDHEVVRRGLVDLLGSDPDLEVVGEAGSVGEAMVKIPALRPDVAVFDVRLPDGNGIELCRDLLSDLPELRCLMLTSYTSEAMLDAILAGASGYIVKDRSSTTQPLRSVDLSPGTQAPSRILNDLTAGACCLIRMGLKAGRRP